MKKYLFFATALIALASCTTDEFTGDQSLREANENKALRFESDAPQLTRTSATDAAKLNYQFRVFGVKTVNSADQRVFATATTGITPYDVWFVDDTNGSTESNSSNWEYVGAAGTHGTTDYEVTLTDEQTIKYWDYSASEYNFQAWSDINAAGSKVAISAIDKNTMTITGTPAQLSNFWLADLQTITPSSSTTTPFNHYGGTVQLTFRKAGTKVRLGIYETIPGYAVKDMKFYYGTESSSSTTNAFLSGSFIGSSASEETFTVTYSGTPQKAVIETSNASSETSVFDFGTFDSSASIGESSIAPTWANPNAATDNYTNVFPNTTNVGNMTLTVDYTLYNDVTNETIKVSGATATVPEEYMTWNPNYAYTYLFKISDNTNGSTGQGVEGLFPITLDAVIIEDADGVQETITTVSTPSITTYAKGEIITSNDEYEAGVPVYVVVNNGTSNQTLTVGTNAWLYTATVESGALQGISEATVDNAFVNGTYDATAKTYTVTDADGKSLVLTDTESSLLTAVTAIAAADSPTGVAIPLVGAKFTPAAGTTYVFQYVVTAPVAGTAAAYTAVANGTMLTAGNTYYTSAAGAGEFEADGSETADGTNYYELTTPAVAGTPGVYQYKVIKVD